MDERLNPVSDEDTRAFQRDGAVRLKGVFDPHWLSVAEAGLARNLAEPSDYGRTKMAPEAGGFFDDYGNWRRIPEFVEYVEKSPAGEIVARLMKSKTASFYHEHVLIKAPGTSKATPWHHDQPYYPVNGDQVCSIWMPLDPVPIETTLRFVKGSHHWGKWFVPKKFKDASDYEMIGDSAGQFHVKLEDYESVPDIDGHAAKYEILAWPLAPGDCVVFSMQTLHGAAGNPLETPRRVFSSRWFGDDARFTTRPWEISPPMTGGLQPGDPMACEEFPTVWSRP